MKFSIGDLVKKAADVDDVVYAVIGTREKDSEGILPPGKDYVIAVGETGTHEFVLEKDIVSAK